MLRYLVCPACQSPFDLDVEEEDAQEVRTGRLRCRGCSDVYPIVRSVPRFVDADAYVGSFSIQRRHVRDHFVDYVKDQSGYELFFNTTGFEASDVRGELILEVGCGYGRFVDVVQQHEGTIIGIDLSTDSIDVAQEFVGHKKHVHLVQCDLFHLPFRHNIFGGIFSIGVLHHTPDTRKAFEALLPYLQPGKPIAIWVYHPRNKASVNRWRRMTGHLSPQWLFGACVLNQALFSWVRALPGGYRFNALVPGASPQPGSRFWQRVLVDFDSHAPRYAHVHTEDEVRSWAVDSGLQDIRVLERTTSMCGRKP